ncbi:hypothetical protein [Pedobacter punctiformis]|uniref:Uncharacterized protein n=1 Tax=Pedobacter punctiformis TaxID=3004097 RepID=A0ABT4L870_9SPHI|nr:hypothetical protein [Pedobacter sp. HCMS5-2]MCZ4244125.1 hypothetical protein [Pedobacter sp. HCMS5-2]
MSLPLIITIAVIAIIAYGGFIYFMMKKRREALQKYDNPEAYKQVPQIMENFLSSRFSALTKQLQGAPVDAFTQCAYITSLSEKATSAAITTAKTVAWAAVGVKARYNEADNASYLVLSGDELHYIFFEENEIKEHLILDRSRLSNAVIGNISNTEKVARMGSVMGRQSHKITIDIDGKKIDLIYYDAIERYPDSVLAFERNGFDTIAQFKLMGKYFKEKFYSKYPNLSN